MSKTLVSYLLNTLCTIAILAINQKLALFYNQTDGKTKALFGLIEVGRFGDQYYLLLPAVVALVLSIADYRKGNGKRSSLAAILFACTVIVLLFSRVWRFML